MAAAGQVDEQFPKRLARPRVVGDPHPPLELVDVEDVVGEVLHEGVDRHLTRLLERDRRIVRLVGHLRPSLVGRDPRQEMYRIATPREVLSLIRGSCQVA